MRRLDRRTSSFLAYVFDMPCKVSISHINRGHHFSHCQDWLVSWGETAAIAIRSSFASWFHHLLTVTFKKSSGFLKLNYLIWKMKRIPAVFYDCWEN